MKFGVWILYISATDNSNCVAKSFCTTLPTKVSYGIFGDAVLYIACMQFIHTPYTFFFLVLQNSLALVDLGDMYVRLLYTSKPGMCWTRVKE